MYNTNFTNNLLKYKNEILHHVSSHAPDFYFNFLNNTKDNKFGRKPTRAEAYGAHIKFTTFTNQGNGFKNFSSSISKLYYVTFNTLEMSNTLAFSIREDNFKYWQEHADELPSNFCILVISNKDDRIYEVPVKNLINHVITEMNHKTNRVRRLNESNAYVDITVCLDNKIISYETAQNHNEYVKGAGFDPTYYQPEHIGNWRTSKYICIKPIRIFVYNKHSDNITNVKTYKSIKELYDILVAHFGYDKSYKTLQRAVSKESRIDLNDDLFIIPTLDTSKTIETLCFEKLIEETKDVNIFFDETQPKSEHNQSNGNKIKYTYNKSKNEVTETEEIHDMDLEDMIHSLEQTSNAPSAYVDKVKEMYASLDYEDERVVDDFAIRVNTLIACFSNLVDFTLEEILNLSTLDPSYEHCCIIDNGKCLPVFCCFPKLSVIDENLELIHPSLSD